MFEGIGLVLAAGDVEFAAAMAHRGEHGGQRQGTELGEQALDHIGQRRLDRGPAEITRFRTNRGTSGTMSCIIESTPSGPVGAVLPAVSAATKAKSIARWFIRSRFRANPTGAHSQVDLG